MQFRNSSDFEKKVVKTEGVHPNLVDERTKCDFNQDQMALVLFGGKERLEIYTKT